MERAPNLTAAFLLSSVLCGCGTSLPTMDVKYVSNDDYSGFTNEIVRHVRCELETAVNNNYDDNPKSRRHIIKKWAAKVALNIKANEKSSLNPALSIFNDPVTFTFAATAGLQSEALRETTLTYFLVFDELIDKSRKHGPEDYAETPPCGRDPKYPDPIAGDLGIGQNIFSSLATWDSRNSISDRLEDPYETITHHVQFIATATGGVTPTWKLMRVSANSAPPFLSGTRTATNDLLITIGPAVLGSKKINNKVVPIVSASTTLDNTFQIERLRTAFPNR